MVRSFLKLYTMDLGIDSTHVLTMRTTLTRVRQYPTAEKRQQFFDALLRAARRAPRRDRGGDGDQPAARRRRRPDHRDRRPAGGRSEDRPARLAWSSSAPATSTRSASPPRRGRVLREPRRHARRRDRRRQRALRRAILPTARIRSASASARRRAGAERTQPLAHDRRRRADRAAGQPAGRYPTR